MCEGGSQSGVQASFKIIMDVVNQHERNDERKAKITKEVENFLGPSGSGLNGFPITGLDMKNRDDFQPLFNQLKVFLYDMSGSN
jgi:hypothetical protein